mgnify:CR=1 FL=1
MATTKMTNRKALEFVLTSYQDIPADVREKLEKMIEQLDRKNAAPRKMTEKQTANEVTKQAIMEFLRENPEQGFTCMDLIQSVPGLEGHSTQHISALMRLLKMDSLVESYSEKRRTYFKVA